MEPLLLPLPQRACPPTGGRGRHAKGDDLVLCKWLSLQAAAKSPTLLADVTALLQHPDFAVTSPNKVRSLVSVFAANMKPFHAKDGSGYRRAPRPAPRPPRLPLVPCALRSLWVQVPGGPHHRSGQGGRPSPPTRHPTELSFPCPRPFSARPERLFCFIPETRGNTAAFPYVFISTRARASPTPAPRPPR